MKCNRCGTYNEDLNSNFCANCGADLQKNSENEEKANNNSNNLNTTNDIKDDSNIFLIIGIVMAVCCSLPFGAGVIIINELMYKKLLKEIFGFSIFIFLNAIVDKINWSLWVCLRFARKGSPV